MEAPQAIRFALVLAALTGCAAPSAQTPRATGGERFAARLPETARPIAPEPEERRLAATLEDLIEGIEKAIRSGGDDANRMARISVALAGFLKTGRLREDIQQLRRGRDVTTYLLYAAPDGSFSIDATLMPVGARTPVHDHQTWLVWGVYRGRNRETRYERRGDPREAFPDLAAISSKTLDAGGVSVVPPPPRDVHRIENVGKEISVAVRVHGTDVRRQTNHAYDLRSRTVTSSVERYEGLP